MKDVGVYICGSMMSNLILQGAELDLAIFSDSGCIDERAIFPFLREKLISLGYNILEATEPGCLKLTYH